MKKCIATSLILLSLCACSNVKKTEISAMSRTSEQPISNAVTQKPKYETYVNKGQLMPVLELLSIDGNTINLAANDNRKLVILFATWCSDSQRAMRALTQSELIREKDLTIIGIARENSVDEVIQFKQDYGLDFDLVADSDRSIYQQFASAGIPRFIMLDENNQIVDAVLAEGENQLDLIDWDS